MKHYVRKFVRKVRRHVDALNRESAAIADPFGKAMSDAFHSGRRTK